MRNSIEKFVRGEKIYIDINYINVYINRRIYH